MLSISPPWLVAIGILATAVAQVLLKKAAPFDVRTVQWMTLMFAAACAYTFSFILYSRILKYYPLNKVYPAMTVAQIILITLYGLLVGEMIDLRQAIGLLLGIVAVYLILS